MRELYESETEMTDSFNQLLPPESQIKITASQIGSEIVFYFFLISPNKDLHSLPVMQGQVLLWLDTANRSHFCSYNYVTS